jgi:hypothetical protein
VVAGEGRFESGRGVTTLCCETRKDKLTLNNAFAIMAEKNWSQGEDGSSNWQMTRADAPSNTNTKVVLTLNQSDCSLSVGGNDVGPGKIKIHETGAGSNVVTLQAPSSLSTDRTFTLPSDQGDTGEPLVVTDTSGTIGFGTKPFFPVYLGHDATVSNTATWMKTINGAENNEGFNMVVAGDVTAMSVQLRCTTYTSGPHTATLELWKNGAATSKTVAFDPGATGDAGTNGTITAESFTAGQTLSAKLQTSSADCVVEDIAVMLKAEY